MISAWLFCWLLLSLMPAINAHSRAAGVWLSVCTLSGFKWVQIDEGSEQPADTVHSKQCLFCHYFPFHNVLLATSVFQRLFIMSNDDNYIFMVRFHRYLIQTPRSPPAFSNA